MRLFQAHHLFAKVENVRAVRVGRRGGDVSTVIDRVDPGQRILLRKDVIDANGPEIFVDGLQRATEDFSDSVEVRCARGCRGPQTQQRLNARHRRGTRRRVRNERRRGLMQILAEALVVGEHEGFVRVERSANRRTELVALKGRGRALIEEISSVERVVAQEFIRAAVPLVTAGLGDDYHLRARVLAEFGAIGIALHIKFAHRINAKEHPARSPRLHVVLRGPRVFHSIKQKQILLRTISGDREVVGARGIGDACAARFLRREIDDARIKRKQQIEAAPVERKFLYGVLPNQATNIDRRGIYDRCVASDRDLRFHGAHLQAEIDTRFLIYDQLDAGADTILKARLGNGDFVFTHRERQNKIAANAVGNAVAGRSRLQTLGLHRGRGNRRS